MGIFPCSILEADELGPPLPNTSLLLGESEKWVFIW